MIFVPMLFKKLCLSYVALINLRGQFRFDWSWLSNDGIQEVASVAWWKTRYANKATVNLMQKLKATRSASKGWLVRVRAFTRAKKVELLHTIQEWDRKEELVIISAVNRDLSNASRGRFFGCIEVRRFTGNRGQKSRGWQEEMVTQYFIIMPQIFEVYLDLMYGMEWLRPWRS